MKVNSKKATTKKVANREEIVVASFEVKNVRVVSTKNGDLIFFTLNLNGIFINNCKVATGKNGDFISFPSYKGSDGNYYNTVYAALSQADSDAILEEVTKAIDADEQPFE